MTTVQVYLLGKDIRRFTNGSNHVVCFLGLFARDVLNLVISLIEGRADEVGESSVDNAELLHAAFFNI